MHIFVYTLKRNSQKTFHHNPKESLILFYCTLIIFLSTFQSTTQNYATNGSQSRNFVCYISTYQLWSILLDSLVATLMLTLIILKTDIFNLSFTFACSRLISLLHSFTIIIIVFFCVNVSSVSIFDIGTSFYCFNCEHVFSFAWAILCDRVLERKSEIVLLNVHVCF